MKIHRVTSYAESLKDDAIEILQNKSRRVNYKFFFLCSERPSCPTQSPNSIKKEEIERLRGKRDQIKFIDLRFERLQVL